MRGLRIPGFDPARFPNDIAALHQIIAAQVAEAEARETELAAAKTGLLAKALAPGKEESVGSAPCPFCAGFIYFR